MPANLENSAVATGLEKVSFHSNPKERQCQRSSSYCTIALILNASQVMLKILHARLQEHINQELPNVQVGFRKGRGIIAQMVNIHWIIEKAREFQKKSTSALLIMPKPLTVWITINWKILNEMGIPGHLICLLGNLYAGQEATVRTGHKITDWVQSGKV